MGPRIREDKDGDSAIFIVMTSVKGGGKKGWVPASARTRMGIALFS